MKIIPLFKPYMPEKLPELNTILHSGSLSYGKWGKQFELRLGEYIGNPKIAVVNSYNSTMLIALEVIGIRPGDEIIASPMSCLASNQPFVTQGAKVVWADINPLSGTLSPESVKEKITSKTKAIFHNHYCGYVGYIDEINSIGKENGIPVVDDAIEAFGSEYKGHKIGDVGSDLTVFSFQTVRLPNTIDGGAISFNNEALYEKALLIRDYGIDRTNFRDNNGEISPKCDITIPAYGASISDVNSYIGCVQMEKIDELLNIQNKNSVYWNTRMQSDYPDCIPLGKNQNPNYWVFGILTPNKNKTIQHFREKGYYASGVHLPNTNYSVFGGKLLLPGVEEFYSKFMALPCGWWFNNIR